MDKIHANGLGSLIKVTVKLNEEKEMVTRRSIRHKRNYNLQGFSTSQKETKTVTSLWRSRN